MTHWVQPPLEADETPYVFAEGTINVNYPVNLFVVDEAEGRPSLPIISIAQFEGNQLVAVPHSTWHRKVSNRVMPSSSMTRVTLLEVAACKHTNMEEPVTDRFMKVWVGYLKEEWADNVHTHLEEFNADYAFDDSVDILMPSANALVSAAQDHFSFFSAEESAMAPVEVQPGEGEEVELQPDLPAEEEGLGSQGLHARVLQLEETVNKVSEGIAQLLSMQTPEPAVQKNKKQTPSRPSALRTREKEQPSTMPARVSFAPPSSSSTGKASTSKPYPSLDSTVVQAAMRAGVPEESLKEMEKLISKNPRGVKIKDTNKLIALDPLSEEEEEGGEYGLDEEHTADGGSADLIGNALMKLTSLVDILAEDKKKKASSSKLDSALDAVSSLSSEGAGGIGSGKKTAAARRALRMTLRDHPEEIHQHLEKMMYEDLQSTTVAPGMAMPGLNARAWVEYRSRIGNFKTSAHAAWTTAGIVDSLVGGDHHRARALALLLLLQLDQTAIDKGNWAFSSELSLEPLPPYNSLSQHQGPNIQDGEQPFSRLLDSRWAEIAMSHLKEQDDYLLRRKNVGRHGKQLEDPDREVADPKRRPKAKTRANAASSSSQQDA